MLEQDFEGSRHAVPTGQTTTAEPRFTRKYAAPEVLQGAPVSLAGDMFAFGMSLCEIVFGSILARPNLSMTLTEPHELEDGRVMSQAAADSAANAAAAALVESLVCTDPEARLTAAGALQHSFFKDALDREAEIR